MVKSLGIGTHALIMQKVINMYHCGMSEHVGFSSVQAHVKFHEPVFSLSKVTGVSWAGLCILAFYTSLSSQTGCHAGAACRPRASTFIVFRCCKLHK